MDHQDLPGWPDDDSHLDDPHLDDGSGHQHFDDADHHLDHLVEPAADLPGHELAGHDTAGHDLGPDDDRYDPVAEPASAPHTGHLTAAYPDDDPFAATHHDPHLDHLVEDVQPDPPPVDTPVGADPDTDPYTDGDWVDTHLPPPLDLPDAPTPVDGYQWADASLIGTAMPDSGDLDPPAMHPPVDDLLDYAGAETGGGADAWQALLGSDDTATSTLARWWSPQT